MQVKLLNTTSVVKNQYLKEQKTGAIQNPIAPKCPLQSNNISFQKLIKPALNPVRYIENYINPAVVQCAIDENPNIGLMFEPYSLKLQVYPKNISQNERQHLLATYIYARNMAEQLHLDRNSQMVLYKSALLHDIGKALIPDIILQKPAKLTPEEKRIVDLHTQLGCEILKTTDIEKDVIEAVRLHHTPFYEIGDNKVAQILSVADVYSALREKRPYKDVIPKIKAFAIMDEMPRLSSEIVGILQKMEYV